MMLRRLVATVLLLASLAVVPASAPPRAAAAVVPAGVTIAGVDAHDGQVYQDGGSYYLIGTRYGCGFIWNNYSTPWCGFGVWSSPALTGPWTFVRNLFDPNGASGTWHHEPWQTICRGDGCFNPRMVQTPDGVWVLWFGAGRDRRVWGANEFWAMGCNGPAGPCGWQAGAPYGSTIKPALYVCNTGGDFSVFRDADGRGYLVCGAAGWTISIERLAPWFADGTGQGARNLVGLQYVEGAGLGRLPSGEYVLTFGANCPYCSGTDTSYAVASSVFGPYRTPPGSRNRAMISPHSCGGQPRTVTTLDGQLYEQIDTWYDQPSETNAATRLEPLVRTGAPLLGTVDGRPWRGGFQPFRCD